MSVFENMKLKGKNLELDDKNTKGLSFLFLKTSHLLCAIDILFIVSILGTNQSWSGLLVQDLGSWGLLGRGTWTWA